MSETIISIMIFVLGLIIGISAILVINYIRNKKKEMKADSIIEKAKKDAELFNESLRSLPGDNSLFLKDPNREYDYIYNRYINEHKIKR